MCPCVTLCATLASAGHPASVCSARHPPRRSVTLKLRVQGTAWLFCMSLVTATSLQARPWGWSSSLGPEPWEAPPRPRLGPVCAGSCRERPLCAVSVLGDRRRRPPPPTGADTRLLPPPRSEHVTARAWPQDGPPLGVGCGWRPRENGALRSRRPHQGSWSRRVLLQAARIKNAA